MTHRNQWLQERADLLATLTEWRERAEAAEAKVARLMKALEPFANAVFYDNSDMTVDMSALGYEDCKRAYFAYRAAIKAMENTDE